jgi:hypothetical protein
MQLCKFKYQRKLIINIYNIYLFSKGYIFCYNYRQMIQISNQCGIIKNDIGIKMQRKKCKTYIDKKTCLILLLEKDIW